MFLIVAGDCAPLQVAVAGRSGSTSCVGDLVTVTCTLPVVIHDWEIPSLGLDVIITRRIPTFPRFSGDDSRFSIAITMQGGLDTDSITTELSVTSFAGLSGANITCSDPLQIIGATQDTIILLFGKCKLVY